MKFLVMEASLHAGENLNVKPIITTPSSTFFQSHVLATEVRLQNGSWILNTGHFPFDQDFLVNFRQFPVVSGTASSKNSKKGDILAWYIQIFESFFPKFSFFCSWNFQNVWLNVHISEIQLFSHFLEIFPGNFCIIHHRLPIPWNFSFYLETGEIILSIKQK